MKKKTLWGKKLLSSAAVLALGVSLLAGCGSTDTPAAGAGGTTDSGKAASGDPFAFESVSDVIFPLEEKLTIDVFVYASLTGGGTYQNNYVTDWIEDRPTFI